KGDVINVPSGATVIDFAYAIHSEVGNHMVGAKVDGRIVPLDYKVKTGQIVEVLTSPSKGPSRDWLKTVTTSSAKTKIRNWFKKERRPENILEGKVELEREFRRNNIRLYDENLDQFLEKLSERQRCQSIDDFYAAIGYGSISINRLMPYIKEEYYKILKAKEPPEINIVVEPKSRSSEGVIVEGVDNCLVKFSRCCNPLPGDDIIGFITRGHGVSIHKRDCSNVPKYIPLASEPERWINVRWDVLVKENFKSTLSMECIDRMGLIADLSSQLATLHVMIHSLNTRQWKTGKCLITMTITVNGVEHLNSVIKRLEKTDGVLNIERSGV
ncbi:MAG: TGS domain-containing protein, partial [Oscillospiraceae bacterium]